MVNMKKSKIYSNTAFIIGNGKSRENFDLEQLRPHGHIYGCNALYRNFAPDYLIAIDDPIAEEIKEAIHNEDFPDQTKFIHPVMEEQFEDPQYNPFSRNRSNAGMNAMIEAIRHGKTLLICLGLDFILNDKLTTGNMYDGTNAYGPETRTNFGDSIKRVRYFEWFARKHPSIDFKLILPQIKGLKIQRLESKNIKGMYYPQLLPYLNKNV